MARPLSFDWRDASLGKVCRDLGEAFHCVARNAGQSTLRFEAQPPAPAGARPVAAVTRSGVTLIANRVERARILNLESAPPRATQECRVQLSLRPADGVPRWPWERHPRAVVGTVVAALVLAALVAPVWR